MKLVMTLLVRDEEDILQSNIEFHLAKGVDFIIATDNLSVDSTADILKEYENKGVLRYIHEYADNYNQRQWVTRMAKMASVKYGADWVINNDADEFWWPLEGSLKDTFSNISGDRNIVIANRSNFVAIEDFGSPFYDYMIYKQKRSLNSLGQSLPPKVAHRACADIRVFQGNHGVDGLGPQNSISDIIEIFHFPGRSRKQLLNKIIKGGAGYERNENLDEEVGLTWRVLYKEFIENGNLDRYFKSQFYSKDRIEKEIESGKLLVDERLKKFFNGL